MNTWTKSFCMILSLSMLSFFALWAEEPEMKTPPVEAEQPKQTTPQPAVPAGEAPSQPPAPPSNVPVRDVFQSGVAPAATPVAASGEPVEIQTNLEGLSIGAKGSRAVINGEVYKEGEDKLGIKVLQIRKKEVDILINQAVKRTLSMIPGETRDIPMAPEETSAPALEEGQKADTPITEGQPENKEPDKQPTYV